MLHYGPGYNEASDLIDLWNAGVRRTRGLTIALGALLLLAGIASALSPLGLYALVQAAVSAALIVGGIAGVASWVTTPDPLRSPVPVVMGVLNALLGIMLLAVPTYLTAETMALLLAVLFLASGAERIALSRRMSRLGVEGSGVSLATGVINVVAGVSFLVLPFLSSLMLVYLMAGYLVVGGASLLVEGIAMHRIER